MADCQIEVNDIARIILEQDELHDWDSSPDMYERYAKAILAAGYKRKKDAA